MATPLDSSVTQGLVAERKRRGVGGSQAATEVPVLSLRRYFEGTADGKAAVAREWDEACREVGFVTVVDHGVPRDVIDACWEETTSFFDRPLAEKAAVPTSSDYPYGYIGMGMENLQASLDETSRNPGDIKEMFNICFGTAEPDPDKPAPRWPAQSVGMRRAWQAYDAALARLSEALYAVMGPALGLREDWFADKVNRHRNVIRAINYPELRTPPLPGQVRASVHTDYGSLTILRLGGRYAGGLQAMGASGEWVDVAPRGQDCFVINLGDLMARWTNDRWLSTPHRVVNPPQALAATARRQSIAYFCNVNMDARVECIPTCEGGRAKYAPIAAGEWLMRKHAQTVAGQLCYAVEEGGEGVAADAPCGEAARGVAEDDAGCSVSLCPESPQRPLRDGVSPRSPEGPGSGRFSIK